MLNQNQLNFYEENGYLKLSGMFSDEEVNVLSEALNELESTVDSRTIVKEKNGDTRSIFAPHAANKYYDRVTKLTRLVKSVEQLLNDDVYLYQHKINIKRAFTGDWWEWHQDFAFWHHEDDVPHPNMVSVMIFLSDMDYESGPLMVIPQSHKDEITGFEDKQINDELANTVSGELKDFASSFTADLKYTVDRSILKSKVNNHRIQTITGKKGDVLFFHCNIIHASNINMSPDDRVALILSYNSSKNFVRASKRPEYISNPDNSAISSDLLLESLL